MIIKRVGKHQLLFVLLPVAGLAGGILISSFKLFPWPGDTAQSADTRTFSQTPELLTPLSTPIPMPADEIIKTAQTAQPLAQESAGEPTATESEKSVLSQNAASLPVTTLMRQFEEEKLARRQLEQTLQSLKDELQTLAQRFDKLESAERNDRNRRLAQNERRRIDTAALVSAGINIGDAELIAQQWNQQEMDMLYLRDQAAREGWLDTAEFRQSAQDIRQGLDSLWQDLDSSAYDRFLYATGRPNRVQISNVIDSSPGQSIGLQAGDIVLNYGGSPIYSGQDLQSATTSGVPDETVIMQIIRDDALIELSIPRGPIGISMAPISVQPQS